MDLCLSWMLQYLRLCIGPIYIVVDIDFILYAILGKEEDVDYIQMQRVLYNECLLLHRLNIEYLFHQYGK